MFHAPIQEDTYLRLFEARHAEELFSLVDAYREDLGRWFAWVERTKGPESARAFIERSLRQFADNAGFHAGIWHEGRLAGVVGCDGIDWENLTTSLGYWLGVEFRGRGLATMACRILVDHAIFELGLNRVEIRCAAGNERGRAVAERLGFREEGVLREAQRLQDRHVDQVLYAMLAHDWRSARHEG